jgi:hypothetical protein
VTDQTARYRHRTAEVEAVQWTGDNAEALRAFCGPDFDEIDLDDRVEDPDETAAVREADHGTWRGLKPGDWVVKLDEGLYEFSAADFAKQYEPAGVAPATDRAAEPLCVCGHPMRLHHEDVCLTDCGCNDGLESDGDADLPDRLAAALTARFTELGNPHSQMRRHEQGPDGWPASHPVGPRQVAEVLRELLAADAVLSVLPATTDRAAECSQCDDTGACNGGPCPLRRMAAEAGPADTGHGDVVCVCGHPIQQHFEDVCLTNCGCNDVLTVEAAAEERARAEAAIHALRSAAEHVRVGVAVGPIPLEVRPAVAAWLCRLADQRRDRAVANAVALAKAEGPAVVGRAADETQDEAEVQLPFIHVDDDGDQLDIGAVMASTYDGEAPVVYVAANQHQGDQVATVYVRPERVDEVIAALRTARLAAETLPAVGAQQPKEA